MIDSKEFLEKNWQILQKYPQLEGLTPILYAAKYGYDTYIEEKIDGLNDAEQEQLLRISNEGGLTIMHFACLHGQTDVIDILLSLKNIYQLPSKLGYYPIHLVFDKNSPTVATKIINQFIQKSQDISDKNRVTSENLAHLAARCDNCQVLEIIYLQCPNLFEQKHSYGRTPLMEAVLNQSLDAIKFLIEHSSITTPYQSGKTIVDYAKEEVMNCDPYILGLLEENLSSQIHQLSP